MNYLFPYDLVPQNSKIVLYGAGNIGKDFYIQLCAFNRGSNSRGGYTLVKWVDKNFDLYESNSLFDNSKNLIKYSFDYIVIAVKNKQIVIGIYGFITKRKPAKIEVIASK